MNTPIVECVANYSEARRAEVVEAIAESITAVLQVVLLDRHSDDDHNRTVLTFAGPPDAVADAAFRSIATAAALIDLDDHHGEHPRIGATDVVPFIPISGIGMSECVELAQQVGRRVADELNIPVYLYEEAAVVTDRRNLENIRRGEYEGLKLEIGKDPKREPDYGPSELGRAGATVIGARHPLIAYNAYLTTTDVSIAKKIARTVRHSSGGLRYVKALGMLVDGRAQVSMNLTNYKATAIGRVVEFIRREAARYGVSIASSELVGLIPEDALVEAAEWYLQLDHFDPEQILERRLRSALAGGSQVTAGSGNTEFLDALAAGTPTPGGGSAAAYTGAAAAALVAMVARLTIGKKKYAAVEAQMSSVLEQAIELKGGLAAAVEQDADAFSAVIQAFRMPQDTTADVEERTKAIAVATMHATQVPLQVARMTVAVMGLAEQAVAEGNLNAITDGGTAAAMAHAALKGAGYNVRVNLSGLTDSSVTNALLSELSDLEEKSAELDKTVRNHLQNRGGLHLA